MEALLVDAAIKNLVSNRMVPGSNLCFASLSVSSFIPFTLADYLN
jgi:hypothetical protein